MSRDFSPKKRPFFCKKDLRVTALEGAKKVEVERLKRVGAPKPTESD